MPAPCWSDAHSARHGSGPADQHWADQPQEGACRGGGGRPVVARPSRLGPTRGKTGSLCSGLLQGRTRLASPRRGARFLACRQPRGRPGGAGFRFVGQLVPSQGGESSTNRDQGQGRHWGGGVTRRYSTPSEQLQSPGKPLSGGCTRHGRKKVARSVPGATCLVGPRGNSPPETPRDGTRSRSSLVSCAGIL